MAVLSRAELLAEIARLRQHQLEDIVKATFVGWTHPQEAEHWERSDRLAILVFEFAALEGTRGIEAFNDLQDPSHRTLFRIEQPAKG